MSAHLPDELLAAHLDGALSPTDREAADAHLDVCARCREELELAEWARAALRALPAELRPPTDIAAAVAEEVAGHGVGATTTVRSVDGPRDRSADRSADRSVVAGPPRWYRAATVAAVAAAIGLAAVIVPTIGGSEQSERNAPAADAGGAASGVSEATRTAGSENDGGDQQDATAAASGAFEHSERDFDVRSLLGLVEEMGPAQLSGESALISDPHTERVACARDAGGDAIPQEARAVRLIAATYEGTPADIAVFAVGPDESRQILVVAAASRDCRLLAVAP